MSRNAEHHEQAALIQWAQHNSKRVLELSLLFAIPNGGQRHIITALRLKAEGVKPGVPDLCLPVARQGYHGLFIEMKAKGGAISPAQRSMHEQLLAQGYAVEVCWDWMEAKDAIEHYLGIEYGA